MSKLFTPFDWYWVVVGDNRVYSSKRADYFRLNDSTYLAWVDAGGRASRIASEAEMIGILRRAGVPPYHLVPCRIIVDRLNAAGKLAAARQALDAADLYTQERWNSRMDIYADDATAIALLEAIGADPAVILAPASGR